MKVMIIDATNVFYMNYFANPIKDGSKLLGGYVGFYNTLQTLLGSIKPSKVYVCWEGWNSKEYRKEIYPEYKGHRKGFKPPFWASNLDEDELKKNQKWQFKRLRETLDDVSVTQVSIEGLEADDAISMLVKLHENDDCVIVSGDADFYQLLSENVSQYDMKKKKLVRAEDVLGLELVLQENYLLAKSVCGDTSDNIKGIERVGFKTLVKRFPELAERKYTLNEMILRCEDEMKKPKTIKVYEKVHAGLQIIERNLRVIRLDNLHELREEKYEELKRNLKSGSFKIREWRAKLAEDKVDASNFKELENYIFLTM